jgi:hypothetical protein
MALKHSTALTAARWMVHLQNKLVFIPLCSRMTGKPEVIPGPKSGSGKFENSGQGLLISAG